MRLFDLKIACYIYNQITEYDDSYCELKKKHNELDFRKKDHIINLLDWLRKWGCRQFKKEDEYKSINSIYNWYESKKSLIPHFDIKILDYSFEGNKENIVDFFDDLSQRIACNRANKGKVQIGVVGTAKILFALRPNLFAPWDNPIYKGLLLKGQGSGYVEYLIRIQSELRELNEDIESSKMKWEDLFSYLDKIHNSYPKLIDEYYWIKYTKKIDVLEIINYCNNQ